MARCGVVLLSPPLVPLPSSSVSRDACSTSCNMGRSSSPVVRILVGRRGRGTSLPGLDDWRCRPVRASGDINSDASAGPVTTSANEKEDLSAKLAAAEAEAEALRKELAARKGGRDASDLSRLKPATPEKRIDGTGYRETIFSGPGNTTGTPDQQPSKWGLSEAELFLSKGAPTEGMGLGGEAMEAGSEEIVTRRLAIGVGITILAVGLAFLKFPTGRPSKPLFLYLVAILRVQQLLKSLEESAIDVEVVRTQLAKAGTSEDIKNNLLSAAAWLDGEEADKASSLAYEIFEYVDQADYSKYFENYGDPTSIQQTGSGQEIVWFGIITLLELTGIFKHAKMDRYCTLLFSFLNMKKKFSHRPARMEFLKFSVQSVKAARQKVDLFLALVPSEALDAASFQLAR